MSVMTETSIPNLDKFAQEAEDVISLIKEDLATLRTGKASVQTLDPVRVKAYGSEMKINELANIAAPDPNLIVIKPWDQSIIENIEKAIVSSDLNLNPVVAGDIIRITVPSLTEERRKELVKLVHKKIESGRVMLRSIRTDYKQLIEDLEGADNISEDDIHDLLEELNKLTQKYMDKLETLAEHKEEELMEF